MTPDTSPSPEVDPASTPPKPEGAVGPDPRAKVTTRASVAWFATAVAVVLLVMLIILILQNQNAVEVHYLGVAGSVSLGTALLIAAVAGAAVVAIVGVVRLTQLRFSARRAHRKEALDQKKKP
jgi:uncharacterized integral membrane protein